MKDILLTFLHASVPLVKQFKMITTTEGKSIDVKNYPLISNVTSSTISVHTIRDIYDALITHATSPEKHCLFKGELFRPLVNESRRAMCARDTLTQLCILDLDKAPFSSPAEFMKAMGLETLSYVWQWSSSAKLTKTSTLSGHIFLLLDKPIHPRQIKAWLMHLNLTKDILKNSITLSNAKASLHWPLDIVVNDNGRIVYIAEPTFIGMKSPIPSIERIQYVQGASPILDTSSIVKCSIETLKDAQRIVLNNLRKIEGLPISKAKTKIIGEHEVQQGVGEATIYEVIDDGTDYIRYNLNGGDSQAYWHPRNNFELLHNFKGEPSLLLREILPTRYAELIKQANTQTITPNMTGDTYLVFRNKHTNRYHKGTWNESEHILDMQTTESPLVLKHFAMENGIPLGDFIPEWTVVFDPTTNEVYNGEKRILNTFVAPPFLRGEFNPAAAEQPYPTIQKVLDSAIGTGAVQEFFLNWLAVIVQYRIKTQTTWILHGNEGTGKGLLINSILKPIFKQYLTVHRASELQYQFNGWMESALIAFIDEAETDIFEKTGIESDLRNYITDSPMTIRRMRTDQYEAPSYINFIFSSNKPLPIRIPASDRRHNVGVFQRQRLDISSYEVDVCLEREVESFCAYLHARKADIDLAMAIHKSEDREMMQSLSLTSIDEFAMSVLAGDLTKLVEYMPDEKLLLEHGMLEPCSAAYIQLMHRFLNETESRISRDELRVLFTHAIGRVPDGANKFTTYLRHHNIHTKRVWDGVKTTYGISVIWALTTEERIALIHSINPTKKLTAVK